MYTKCIHSLVKSSIGKVSIGKSSLSKSICTNLTNEEWDRLDNHFENLTGLIDLIDDRLRLTNEVISKPYAYIIKVGTAEKWRTK